MSKNCKWKELRWILDGISSKSLKISGHENRQKELQQWKIIKKINNCPMNYTHQFSGTRKPNSFINIGGGDFVNVQLISKYIKGVRFL